MKIAFFSIKPYDRKFFEAANQNFQHELFFLEPHLTTHTASLAKGFPAVCAFVNDTINEDVLKILATQKTRVLALRSAGFNHVDLTAACKSNITVVRVPAYSPYAVAEHTIALLLTLNRKIHKAYARVREGNFSLDGLLGSDLHGQTVGIIGTGRIGTGVARILSGFGCKILAYDPVISEECKKLGVQYAPLSKLFDQADIISLHCPLTPDTFHLVNDDTLNMMKKGVILLNTSRGGVVDTKAIVRALKSGKIGYLGLDVYEEEEDFFFEDLSNQIIQDDVFTRLLTFPNVLITAHQGFFTKEALENIAKTTLANISDIESGRSCANSV